MEIVEPKRAFEGVEVLAGFLFGNAILWRPFINFELICLLQK